MHVIRMAHRGARTRPERALDTQTVLENLFTQLLIAQKPRVKMPPSTSPALRPSMCLVSSKISCAAQAYATLSTRAPA